MHYQKKTKIVATIGPASYKTTTIEKMIHAGMNVARLNFSHGTHESQLVTMQNVRAAAKKTGKTVTIVADLQGPKVRLGVLPEPVTLKAGEKVVISTAIKSAVGKRLPTTYKGLHKDLKKGDVVLLADGLLEFSVEGVRGTEITCKVVVGGTLSSHKGIIVPTATLHVPILSEKDKLDLDFAIKHDADFIAMSFVMTKDDVVMMRRLIAAAEKKYHKKKILGGTPTSTRIIVKIEKHEAVTNFDEILEVADAVMVARGDLGVETPMETVPIVQKMIIAKCLQASKPVITATQMLGSMVANPRPTRAEVSDVANAVIDHTDAVMLSDETAVGKYPVRVIETMRKIVERTEESPYDDITHAGIQFSMIADAAISSAASSLATITKADAIVVATLSGRTARIVSTYRPTLPILATAHNEKIARQMNLSWGVNPFIMPTKNTLKAIVKTALQIIRSKNLVQKDSEVVMVAGDPPGSGVVNYVKVEKIK